MSALCLSHILCGLFKLLRKKMARKQQQWRIKFNVEAFPGLSCFWIRIIFFTIMMSEFYVFLCKRSEKCLLNYPPFQHGHFFVTTTTAHLINKGKLYIMQSFTTSHSQTSTQCFPKCDYAVCLQTSLGSLRPAVLQHFGTVVQKGLKKWLKQY